LESGRDKEYFKHSSQEKVSDYYLERVKYGLTEIPIKTNFFMHYLLTGKISVLLKNHPYLDKDNFYKLKILLNKKGIEFLRGDIFEYLLKSKPNSFSKFNLSDVFETKTQKEYENILKELIRTSKQDSILCYWNNLVTRSENKINDIKKDKALSEELYKKDRVHFYSRFIVERINKQI